MAVTTTTRFDLPQWSSGSDAPVTRAQLTGAFAALGSEAAGYLEDTAANRPAAAAANKGFLFRATDTGVLSISTGAAWLTVPTGTFLATSGGQLTGPLDMNNQELQNAIVQNARDKRYTANISGAAVIDANNGPNQTLTLTGNVSGITVNNLGDGESLRLTLVEDGTGGRTVVWPNTWLWPGGASANTSMFKTTANAKNALVLEMIGSDVHAFLAGDMKT